MAVGFSAVNLPGFFGHQGFLFENKWLDQGILHTLLDGCSPKSPHSGPRMVGVSTWRIIPVSKWLITMVSKSIKWGCSPCKWPKWLINGGY